MRPALLPVLFCLWATNPAAAQSVTLSGMLGAKALIMVDGSAPKAVAPGESFREVKVISTQGDAAVLEIAGLRLTLHVGDAPASVGSNGASSRAGAPSASGGTRVVLQAGSGGHFFSQGQINGRSATLVVDTGATVVSLSAADAQRMGVNYKAGQLVQMSTANGMIPAWKVKLSSVRLGDVEIYDLDAVVSSGEMPFVLLGNSFLSHFQMTRTNDQMVLDKRF
jgi:aspartyl protease family protein